MYGILTISPCSKGIFLVLFFGRFGRSFCLWRSLIVARDCVGMMHRVSRLLIMLNAHAPMGFSPFFLIAIFHLAAASAFGAITCVGLAGREIYSVVMALCPSWAFILRGLINKAMGSPTWHDTLMKAFVSRREGLRVALRRPSRMCGGGEGVHWWRRAEGVVMRGIRGYGAGGPREGGSAWDVRAGWSRVVRGAGRRCACAPLLLRAQLSLSARVAGRRCTCGRQAVCGWSKD